MSDPTRTRSWRALSTGDTASRQRPAGSMALPEAGTKWLHFPGNLVTLLLKFHMLCYDILRTV